MPGPYRPDDLARLKGEIVAAVEAGATMRAVCARAGMPCVSAVRKWAAADAEFAAAMRLAWVRGKDARRRFDPVVAQALLARARAGESVNALLREPGMPGRKTYEHWRAIEPPFAEAIHAFRLRRDAQIGEHGRARYRAFDQALADRIIVGLDRGARLKDVLAADPELPCMPILRRWRRQEPAFGRVVRTLIRAGKRRRSAAPGCTPQMVDEIVRRIVEGASFASLGRQADMPSRQTLRRWLRARPDFAQAVARACEDREDWYNDQLVLIAEAAGAGPGGLAAAKRRGAPLARQLARLRHRPGAAHRRRAV